MSDKDNKNRLFIYRDVRLYFEQEYTKFNITKYCIYERMRRTRKWDTNAFEGKQKDISDFLDISTGSVSGHIKTMVEHKILEKINDGYNGYHFIDGFDWDKFFESETKRGSFIILDFNIYKRLKAVYKDLNLNQFATLTLIFSIYYNKHRELSKKSIKRLTMLDKETVESAICKFKELGILEDCPEVKLNIEMDKKLQFLLEEYKRLYFESNSEFHYCMDDKNRRLNSFGSFCKNDRL